MKIELSYSKHLPYTRRKAFKPATFVHLHAMYTPVQK